MPEIRTLAIIGAGSMGWSIASAGALAGYRTIVEDILPASLRRAEAEIRGHLEQSIAAGNISRAAAEAALRRLEYADTVEEAARQADVVIENVPDELESKLEILTLLDKVSRPHTILACTTSTFSIAEIAGVTYRANKIVGLRFANSDEKTGQLEIVRSGETSDETVLACTEMGRRMGRTVVVVEEHARNAILPPMKHSR
jgi:3-hydroxybutyryl-CoA dehydrogenase